jgi:hypothetical protein
MVAAIILFAPWIFFYQHLQKSEAVPYAVTDRQKQQPDRKK